MSAAPNLGILERSLLAVLPHLPKSVLRRFAIRYIAGETLESALAKLAQLARAGHPGILDILGEDVTSASEARGVIGQYAQAARAVAQHSLDCYVSVKPTHCGLRLDEKLARTLYAELASICRGLKLFLRVEMEDHTTTDATLALFESLRAEHDNLGIVLQSRLLRTPDDIARLAPGPLSVRLVKGIYLEPASIAHTQPDAIREAFVECTRALFARGARVSFATHDEPLGERLLALVRERGVEPSRYEFQLLLGVKEELWARWRAAGHVVRIYVPYGPEWRPYSLRRMRKNPQILRHVLRQALRLS